MGTTKRLLHPTTMLRSIRASTSSASALYSTATHHVPVAGPSRLIQQLQLQESTTARCRCGQPLLQGGSSRGSLSPYMAYSTQSRRSMSTSLRRRQELASHTATPLNTSVPPPASATAGKAAGSSRAPRREFKAVKAAISLTPTAIGQLQGLLASPPPKLIRIGVRNKGCAGMSYHLEYVDKPGKFDEIVEQDGVRVLIDSKALFSIVGSEMDWQEDKISAKFVFNNPNIKEQCGCGESFLT